MGLERRTVTYQEQPYTRLIGTKVKSKEQVRELAEAVLGGNYFYGGVLNTGSELQPYFGQGPSMKFLNRWLRKLRKATDKCAPVKLLLTLKQN